MDNYLYIFGIHTEARFLAFIKDNPLPIPFNIGENDDYPTTESVSGELGKVCTRIEERRDYYWLSLDPCNQPSGIVKKISLFPTDYISIRECKDSRLTYPYWWIFDNENDAIERALD